MPNALALSLAKKTARPAASVRRNHRAPPMGSRVQAQRSVLGLVLAVAPMHYEETSSHSNILIIGRSGAKHAVSASAGKKALEQGDGANALLVSSFFRRADLLRRERRRHASAMGGAGRCAHRIQGLGRRDGWARYAFARACAWPPRLHRFLSVHHSAGRSLFARPHGGGGRPCA